MAQAQVATAPLVPDQRLVNPAALTYRSLRGYSLSLRREIEKSRAPTTSKSSLGFDTTVDTVAVNYGWANAPYFFEANLLPQFGTRDTKSSFKDTTGSENAFDSKRQITLVPAQGLFAIRLGELACIGAKALYTNSSFDTNDQFGYSFQDVTFTSTTTGLRTADFLTASAGAVVNVFDTGLYFGYSSEFLQLKDDVMSQSTGTNTRTTGTTSSTMVTNRKTTTTLRKDIMGVGFLTKFSGGNIWRIDFSQEKMPPLDPSKGTEGKLARLVTEATWSYFHAGIQVTSTSGYYIDPYNLIPYFFGDQDFYADSVIEYEFFGGLKSSKGHSFGLSYSQSTKSKTQPSGGPEPLILEVTEISYGLSYMYAF